MLEAKEDLDLPRCSGDRQPTQASTPVSVSLSLSLNLLTKAHAWQRNARLFQALLSTETDAQVLMRKSLQSKDLGILGCGFCHLLAAGLWANSSSVKKLGVYTG